MREVLFGSGSFSAFFVLPDSGPLTTEPSVFIFAILSCLFTYASDLPGELVKMKFLGLYIRDCFSRFRVGSRNLHIKIFV